MGQQTTTNLLATSSSLPLEDLMPLVYRELRHIAHRALRREGAAPPIQTTALVHEAFLRCVGDGKLAWQGRPHFLACSALAMRRILVDLARERRSLKRGGQAMRVACSTDDLADEPVGGVLELDRALASLARLDARQAKVVELRYFGGLTENEVATTLGVSVRTVQGDWRIARSWLRRELSEQA